MRLIINSPAYFSEDCPVDDEINRFIQQAYEFFLDREYSDTLHIVSVQPMAAPQEEYDRGMWEESTRLIHHKSGVVISLRLNLDEYLNADSGQRIRIIRNAVLAAVEKISTRGNFDYESFEQDFDLLVPGNYTII